jgi:sortase (surface protein transpeptidase)
MKKLRMNKPMFVAVGAAGMGLLLLSVVAVYIYLDLRSGSDAGEFNVSISPDDLPPLLGQTAPPPESPLSDTEFAALAGLYPGDRVNPKFWDTPQFAGSTPFGGAGIPEGFEPVDSELALAGYDPLTMAAAMRIPAINLSSSVKPLEILDLGDSTAYQTPDNTVGFIPETGAPANFSTGWYFGHLEGFVSGEGSVFRRLPEIAQLIREDPVDIFLATAEAEYMYRVTSTYQVSQDDLALYNNERNDVVLVTCWPTRIYDQRVVVTAELIAVRQLAAVQG